MADSDGEFIQSDDDELPQRAGGTRSKGKQRQRAAWEASIHDRENPLLREGKDGKIIGNIREEMEGRKRMRWA
jgi:hypothetical protein